jgi:hypothetical protein
VTSLPRLCPDLSAMTGHLAEGKCLCARV